MTGTPKKLDARGFTLIELLVVITIILIVSIVALPTVLPALSHRQASEATRIVQSAIVGARDSAIKNNRPSGIRLLPDPAWPISYPTNSSTIDSTLPLAANRIIPIASAPDYSEGLVIPITNPSSQLPSGFSIPNGYLMVAETVVNSSGLVNPTSWFWNVRVGDKIQINNSGPYYTVVGPISIGPAALPWTDGITYANTELFVNVGPPGTKSDLSVKQSGTSVNPEYLYLVNGQDDNGNGWIDEEFDGIDNDGNGLTDSADTNERETEAWLGSLAVSSIAASETNVPYTIRRRPAPVGNAREVILPTNMVVDMSGWGLSPQPRSRLPVNPYNGAVDILLNPNGTVVLNTIYSTPAINGMNSAFVHFWLAERTDVASPVQTPQGSNWLITIALSSGRVSSLEQPDPVNGFTQAQQGAGR